MGRRPAHLRFTRAENFGSSSIRAIQWSPTRVCHTSGWDWARHRVPALMSKSHTGPNSNRLPGLQVKFTLDWKLESWLPKSSSTRYQSMSSLVSM